LCSVLILLSCGLRGTTARNIENDLSVGTIADSRTHFAQFFSLLQNQPQDHHELHPQPQPQLQLEPHHHEIHPKLQPRLQPRLQPQSRSSYSTVQGNAAQPTDANPQPTDTGSQPIDVQSGGYIDRSDSFDPQFVETADGRFDDLSVSNHVVTTSDEHVIKTISPSDEPVPTAPRHLPGFSLPIVDRDETLKDIYLRERMPKIQETLASGDQEAIAKLIAENKDDPFTVLPKQLKYYELLAADLYFSFLTKMVTWFVMISLLLPALVPLFTILSLGAEIAAIYLIPNLEEEA